MVGSSRIHSLRLPGYSSSCEVIFGVGHERLMVRHDAGSSAAVYLEGTLYAAGRVTEISGLVRGLDQLWLHDF